MNKSCIAKLRKQIRNLWFNQRRSLADIENQLSVDIVIGGDLAELPCFIFSGNFGVYPKT